MDDLEKIRNKAKANRLTIKQRKWLLAYIETGNATEAARRTYHVRSDSSAREIGHQNLAKLDYPEFLELVGVSDLKLIEALGEGLEASKIKPSLTEPDRVIPDYSTRHQYLETALKLKGKLLNRQELKIEEYSITLDI